MPFNQPIGNWNTSKVSRHVLVCLNFNQPAFNQPIGRMFNVASVTTMKWMFKNMMFQVLTKILVRGIHLPLQIWMECFQGNIVTMELLLINILEIGTPQM